MSQSRMLRRVVHVITGLRQGGAEAMLEKLVRESLRQTPDVEHRVISLTTHGDVGPRLVSLGVGVTSLGARPDLSALRALPGLTRLMRREARGAGTVVQTWLYHADLLGGVAARMAGVRHLFWNLRVVVHRPDFSGATFAVLRACALLSRVVPQRIVACGPEVLASHVRHGYDARKGVVIGNGFDPALLVQDAAQRERLRSELGIAESDTVVITVARAHRQKDYATLARAARLVRERGLAVRFLWVGAGVESDADLTDALGDLGAFGAVIRLPQRRDVPDLLVASDAYCLASRSEGFPNALGEAMAVGLPCITTRAGDAAFLLGDDRWVVGCGDAPGLADALERLLALSPTERRRVGEINRERIRQHFSIAETWRRYVELYSRCLART